VEEIQKGLRKRESPRVMQLTRRYRENKKKKGANLKKEEKHARGGGESNGEQKRRWISE